MTELMVSSTVLILAVLLLRFLFQNAVGRRVRYALWGLVLLRLLIPVPLLPSAMSVMNAVPTAEVNAAADIVLPVFPTGTATGPYYADELRPDGTVIPYTGPREPVATTVEWARMSLGEILTLVRAIGACCVALWFLSVNSRFYATLKKTRRRYDGADCKLPVYLVDTRHAPCLFGLIHPSVYLTPQAVADEQTARHILTHELTHYRHLDHIWSFLRVVCLCLYWFHPLVWVAAWLSRVDCELACDEAAVRRLGEEHRVAYGRTLVDMITAKRAPDMILCATTMAARPRGIKRRIDMIVRNRKTLLPALLLVLAAAAVIAGCTFTGADSPPPVESDPPARVDAEMLYRHLGVDIALPIQYADALLVDMADYDGTHLLSVYDADIRAQGGEGMGWIFSLYRYSEAQHEQYLCSDGSGWRFFARDDAYYYGFLFPTDVQFPRDYEWPFGDIWAEVEADFIARNGLTPHSDEEFFARAYTYNSDHVVLDYYPYRAYPGYADKQDVVWQIVLSQPVARGERGIWCVERWTDDGGNVHPYFPDARGVPSREYYFERQTAFYAGGAPGLDDPTQVALAFVKQLFGHDDATEASFDAKAPAPPPALTSTVRRVGDLPALEEHPAGVAALALIDSYFAARAASFATALNCPPPDGAPAMDTLPVSAEVVTGEAKRTEQVAGWFDDARRVAVSYAPSGLLPMSDTEFFVSFYEWTTFYWSPGGGSEFESGMGEDLTLHIKLLEDGSAFLVASGYINYESSNPNGTLPPALLAALSEVSPTNLAIPDTGQSHDEATAQLMAAWNAWLLALGPDSPFRLTDCVLLESSSHPFFFPVPEGVTPERDDPFRAYAEFAVKPAQPGSVPWWAFLPEEGEGEWEGWTIVEWRCVITLEGGMWHASDYNDGSGPT